MILLKLIFHFSQALERYCISTTISLRIHNWI